MKERREMKEQAREILDKLYEAKNKADAYLDKVPPHIHDRVKCSLWHEKFSLSLRGVPDGKWINQIQKKIIKKIAYLTGIIPSSNHYQHKKGDILFLYGSQVHKDIVNELISRLKDHGLIIGEKEDFKVRKQYIFHALLRGRNVLRNDTISYLSDDLFILFLHYTGLLISHPYDIVVSFNETSTSAGLLSYLCSILGCVSVNIAHAVSVKSPLFQNSPYDYHLVFGEKSKSNIEECQGIVEGEIVPIGALKMDPFFKKETCQKLNNRILVVGSWKGHFLDEILEYVYSIMAQFVKKTTDYSFIYKPHPLEVGRKQAFAQKFDGLPNCEIISPYSNLCQVLDSVDMVMLGWSSVGLESAARGKPVIVVNPCNIPDWLSYTESGFGVEATSRDEILKAVHHIYNNYEQYRHKADEFVRLHLSNREHATDSACEFLLEILKNKGK